MLTDDLTQRQLIASFLVSGLVIGSAVTFLGMKADKISKQKAGEKVVETLERQSGQQLELIKTDSSNGLYEVSIKDSQDTVNTYYVTKDGKKLSANLMDIDQVLQVSRAREDFSQCLGNKSLALYGNLSQRETQLQIQLLGGARYVSPFYVDINNEQALQQAAELGINRVPAMYYNGSTLDGVNRIQDIEKFTGCSFEAGQQ